MPLTSPLRLPSGFSLAVGLSLLLPLAAFAERADRGRPMSLESEQPCIVNLAKQVNTCSGNVVLTQGTLVIRADKLELRETADGYRVASAIGSAAKPAQYREKRDGVDEYVEGTALRIEYDGRASTLRFEGQAQVRRLRDGTTADEIHGNLIVWDSNAEQFSVTGGAASPGNPGGRVRAILAPSPAAVASAQAASAAAAKPPASSPAPSPALRSTPKLGVRQ